MWQKGTESNRDREGKMTSVVKTTGDIVVGPSFTLDWECPDMNRCKWGRPWLSADSEKSTFSAEAWDLGSTVAILKLSSD